MLKETLLWASRNAALRSLARAALNMPLVGPPLRRVSDHILPRGQRTWVQIRFPNVAPVWMKVEPYWEPGYLKPDAEPGVFETLQRFLRPGDCFYDVGAHVGYYSLFASRVVGLGGRVVAFEPDPEIAEVLRETFERNGLTQSELVNSAVWDRDGEIEFARGADIPSRMGGKVLPGGDPLPGPSASTERMRCRAVRLDTFGMSSPRPAVIKIDVEGAELTVLKGALALLQDCHPVMLIEAHDPGELPRLDQLLQPLGCRREIIGDWGVKLHVAFWWQDRD